ncbi:MAG TPA: HAMP domain-containing sensor histidine kinase [Pyrinomonadaceae bacterium]
MRRGSWITYGIVAVIVGLLTVFMALLYNWQVAASEAESEQLQRRAEADAKAFADEFNREIQGAYFNFQTDPNAILQGDATDLSQRYEYWQRNTAYPDLIRQIVFIPNDGQAKRFDPSAKSFVPAVELSEIAAVSARLRSEGPRGAFIEDHHALAVPLHPQETKVERVMIRRSSNVEAPPVDLPKPAGYIAVFLDQAVIRERMLPELTARHFPEGSMNVGVTNRGGESIFANATSVGTPDATAGLLDLRPDHFIFYSKIESLRQREEPGGADADVIVDQRIESRTQDVSLRRQEAEGGKTFTIQMRENGAEKRTAVISGTQASTPWQLGVQHQAGSIDAFVTGERYKYLAIGFGIYLLLVGSILAIVFSSMRAKAFAQRQIDFVSSVSHEFRTPLAVIYSAGENLADGVARDGEQVSRYGTLIKGEGKKLSAMVEQILEFAGARSGRKKYNLVAGDVSAAVAKALQDSEPVLKETGFEVESSLSADLPKASIDREAIETAVRNLIQNAVKYSNGTRWVRVATENGNGSIKIVVEDRGIGISDSDIRNIFEPFYRGKEVVDAQIHGNGLGLSLVKEIAESHGGKVSVESESGKGSRFVLSLPTAD